MRSEDLLHSRRPVLAALFIVLCVLPACRQSPEQRSARFLKAGRELLAKDPAKAVLQFRNAVQTTPQNAEAYYQLGVALLAAGDAANGIASLRRAMDIDPNHAASHLRMAELMVTTNDPELLRSAKDRLERLLQTPSANDPDALHALAFTELRLGQPEEAMEHLATALRKAPQSLATAVTLARAKLLHKDARGAEETLLKACADAPGSADAIVVLGSFYSSQKRLADAEQQYRRALNMDARNIGALLYLAQVQSQSGKHDEAEQNLKTLASLRDPATKHYHAAFLMMRNRRDEAIAELESIYKADPSDRLSRTRLVGAYRAVGRTAEAQSLIDAALKKNPKDSDALLQRAELLIGGGKYDQADIDLNAVLRLQPNSAEAHYMIGKLRLARGTPLVYREELYKALELNSFLLPVRLELARALVSDKQGKAALDLLDQAPASQRESLALLGERNWVLSAIGDSAALRAGIDAGLARGRTTELLLQDGMWKLAHGNPSGARASLEEALRINPDDIRALDVLRQTYAAQKQPVQAVQKIKQLAAEQPKSAAVQQFLGTLLLAQGDKEEARVAFVAAKQADPRSSTADLYLVQLAILDRKWDDAQGRLQAMVSNNSGGDRARQWLGQVEMVKGNYPAAAEHFRKVLAASPDDTETLNNLAYILADRQEQLDEALKLAQRARERAPANLAIADTLGWVLYRKGLYSPAIQHLEAAASLKGNAVPAYHLAMAYAKSGNRQKAQTALQTALKINPNAAEAEEAKRLLEQSK